MPSDVLAAAKRWLRILPVLPLLAALTLLEACAPAIVAGAATTASATQDRRTLGVIVDDEAIELRVSGAVRADPERYRDSHIEVTSHNGVVLLTGEVASEAQREAIRAVPGGLPAARHVEMQLIIGEVVSLPERSRDSLITAEVKSRFLATRNFESAHIRVVTRRRIVYLLGKVSHEEGARAANIAAHMRGVVRVVKLFDYPDSP